jgi:hypothetical protein
MTELDIHDVGGPTAVIGAGGPRLLTDPAFDAPVLFAGAAQPPPLPGADLTLGSVHAAEAARILGARQAVPLHSEHWAHSTQNGDTLVEAFEQAGIGDRQHLLAPGGRFASEDAR